VAAPSQLRIGTSGFSYPEWKPAFYPKDVPQRRFLEHYASVLGAVEVNATFYRLQAEKTFLGWLAMVPDEFRFVVKAHRGLTHTRDLPTRERRETGGLLDRFLESLEPLEDRLGTMLVQLPPTRQRDDAGLEGLLAAMGTAERPVAVELRHESWLLPEIACRIADAGGTLCFADYSGEVPARLPPGPIAYVRMRADRYTETQREGWLELLRREAESRPVYAFAKHEGVPPDDPYAGVGLASWMVARSRGLNSSPAATAPRPRSSG
jgi:uncharacterized protein YecE (DUF72 family)